MTCDSDFPMEVEDDDNLPGDYPGSFETTTGAGNPVYISLGAGRGVYKYCNQDIVRYKPWLAFPAIPSMHPKGGE